MKQQAELRYSEKSWAGAHELYLAAVKLELPAAERRWVEFRVAETDWRSTGYDGRMRARRVFSRLLEEADDDRVAAEVHEVLGDMEVGENVVSAQTHYGPALEYWAAHADVALARRRYRDIVFGLAVNDWNIVRIERELLVNTIRIVDTPGDRARARYLLALRDLRQQKPEWVERGLEQLELVLREGKTEWYDDALFALASQLDHYGSVVVFDNNDLGLRPDYVRAAELYRRLLTESTKGETPHHARAQQALATLESPSLDVAAGTVLPDTEQELALVFRNLDVIHLSIVPVNLTTTGTVIKDVSGKPVREWTVVPRKRPQHAVGAERILLTPRLPAGAYVVMASGGGKHARTLLLVTRANLVVHASGERLHVYVSDAVTGAPLPGAHVRILDEKGAPGKARG
ncbi:MAG TPA: hypothetical protein VF618_09200 [Thermoanaerobaculia bacterium]